MNTDKRTSLHGKWALILGASSGFGKATALALAQEGMNIVGVHLDKRSALPEVQDLIHTLSSYGSTVRFFNKNASALENIEEIGEALPSSISLLFHSLAFGSLRPFVGVRAEESLTPSQLQMTMEVMAHSLVYWTQVLYWKGCLKEGSHIIALTSQGGRQVWPEYGAVSAAKSALESYVRQLSCELAPKGILVNALRPGVTDTPALRKIPQYRRLMENALSKNPHGRLTTPEDVAGFLVGFLSNGSWVTGNVIGIDGGEGLVV